MEELLLLHHKTSLPNLLEHPSSVRKHVGRIALAVNALPLNALAVNASSGHQKKKVTKKKDNKTARPQKKKEPIDPDDFGVIDFMAPRGTKVKLIAEEEESEHEDGPTGEVFLRTYSQRKKMKEEVLPSKHVRCVRMPTFAIPLTFAPLPVAFFFGK